MVLNQKDIWNDTYKVLVPEKWDNDENFFRKFIQKYMRDPNSEINKNPELKCVFLNQINMNEEEGVNCWG